MWIIEVVLKNFGKFKDKKILLSEGINLIYGENESGKTTVFTGIRAMLFGLTRGRGKAAKGDTFSQYEPWEEGNYYAGVLRFACEDRKFQIARRFDKYGKSAHLFCETDGEELSVEDGDLEMLLDGMDEAAFINTVLVGQRSVETSSSLVAEMKNYAVNYFATGNSEINLAGALQILKERKKNVEREMRDLKHEKQEKRDRLELEASYIWKDLRSLEKEREKFRSELEGNQTKKETWEANELEEDGTEEGLFANWRVHPATSLGMILVLAVAFFFVPKPWNYLIVVVLALAEGMFVWGRIKDGRKKKNNAKAAERQEVLDAIDKLEWQLGHLEEEYQEKRVNHMNLKEQIGELDEVGDDFKAQEEKRKALELAEEVMIRSSKEMQIYLEEKLNDRVSEILSALTDGKYDRVWVDEELHMSLYSEGRKINMEQVSRGTVEQIYFALRMAAIEILHDEEYPVILDDTFVYYDDARCEAAIKWLQANKKQVIILTCQKREEEILRKNGLVFNKVVL